MKRPVSPFGDSRVRLRLLEAGDLDTTLAWRNRDDVRVWFKNAAPISRDQHYEWFKCYLAKDDDFVFAVTEEERLAGQASLYRIRWDEAQAEVGRFIVAPERRGRGIIKMACSHLVAFAWETFDLEYLYLEVMAHNHRAIRLYREGGFEEERYYDGLVRMGIRRR